MPRVRTEKTDLRTKFDKFRQDDDKALGLVRPNTKRPLTSEGVTSVHDCERFRTDIVKEIVGRVERINDRNLNDLLSLTLSFLATLDEYRVRDLNDLINRKFKGWQGSS